MNARSNAVKMAVTFHPREDGGLRAWSEDVPGFVLSHSDPREVLADVEPALEAILHAMFNVKVTVSELVSVQEGIEGNVRVYDPSFTKVFNREYVGLMRSE